MYVDEVQALAQSAFDELHENTYYQSKWQPANVKLAAAIDSYFADGGTPPALSANHFGNALTQIATVYRAMIDYDCSAPKVVYE